MIFDPRYDAALWYIVKADKLNREELKKFIKEIPESLLKNIRDAIAKFNRKEFVFDDQTSDYFHCVSKNDSRMYYYFQLDEDGALKIATEYYDGVSADDLFEIMLFPVGPEDVKQLPFFYDEWIGSVANVIRTTHYSELMSTTEENETEYNIYRTPFGYFVSGGRDFGDSDKDQVFYRPISLRKVPKDLNIDQL